LFQEIVLSPDDEKLDKEIDSIVGDMERLQNDIRVSVDTYLQEITTSGTNRQLAHRGVYEALQGTLKSISKKEESLAKCAAVSNKEYAKKYLEAPILEASNIPKPVLGKMSRAGLIGMDGTYINPGIMGKPEKPV
jgi:hypothetical protein